MNALFNDLNQYEQILMRELCSDKDIVSIITNIENPVVPQKSLAYKNVFPFAYIPYTNQEANTFITFTIIVPRIENSLIKQMYVTFEVIVHESIMRTDKGKRTTRLATAIEQLFNGSKFMGISKMELASSDIDIPVRGYHTRRLTYKITDWNRVNKWYA